MVDSSKRNSLKSLGGLAAMPFVPVALTPAISQASTADKTIASNTALGNGELDISMILGDAPAITVTNNSNTLTILRRIHPGVVHAGSASYDLNHALAGSAYAIGAGSSRTIPITAVRGAVTEPTSSSIFKRKQLKVAGITSNNTTGRVLNNSRVFYA